MKKIIYLIPSLILIVILSECAGYKPIFGSSNLNFIISDYSIEGEKSLGNQFYNNIINDKIDCCYVYYRIIANNKFQLIYFLINITCIAIAAATDTFNDSVLSNISIFEITSNLFLSS